MTISVCIAWDTYQKGDYDVYYATMTTEPPEAKFSEPVPMAATLGFEANPSVVYDNQNRLWVAWEQAGENWGKDWGALDREQGIPLYQAGRNVVVKCFVNGRPHRTAREIRACLPRPLRQTNNLPRLSVDGEGRVWLVFRHRGDLELRTDIGTTWFDYACYYSGAKWSNPIFVTNSDGLMSSAPALVQAKDGILLAVYNSDGRRHEFQEPVNNKIWTSSLPVDGTAPPPTLIAEQAKSLPDLLDTSEAEDVARLRAYRITVGGKTLRPIRGDFHRHTEISLDGVGDGTVTDMFRYALDAAALDWVGHGDHDNGGGREYSWWITQKLTDVFHIPNTFMPMFSYERSVPYPDGHRNVMFAERGIRTLPRLRSGTGKDLDKQPDVPRPHSRETQMLYKYLKFFKGICSSHTSATGMGTDWRDNDPEVEPVIKIYQGFRQSYEYEGAPKSGNEKSSLGGWRPAGFYWNALAKGYRLGIQASSDHHSTHISYAIVYVEEPTRQAIIDAFKKRHCYGATDNILLDVRMGDKMMGDEFTSKMPPKLDVKIVGTDIIKKVDIIRDNKFVYTSQPKKKEVVFTWQDSDPKAGTSYYYVRVQQANDEMAWASPMWINYEK